MDSCRENAALYQPTSPGQISSRHRAGKDGTWIRANVAVHQKENEIAGKKEGGEEKRQATDFKETEYCSFAVVQKVARQKND